METKLTLHQKNNDSVTKKSTQSLIQSILTNTAKGNTPDDKALQMQQNQISLIETERNLTVRKALQGVNNHKLAKEYKFGDLIKVYSAIIEVTIAYFSVPTMAPMKVVETASLIITDFPTETIEDFIMAMRRAKRGDYGPPYFNRIDGQVIISWFTLYLEEKYAEHEKIVYEKKIETMQQEKEWNPENAQVLKKINEAIHLKNDGYKPKPKKEKPITLEEHFEHFRKLLPGMTTQWLEQAFEHYTHINNRLPIGALHNYENYLNELTLHLTAHKNE